MARVAARSQGGSTPAPSVPAVLPAVAPVVPAHASSPAPIAAATSMDDVLARVASRMNAPAPGLQPTPAPTPHSGPQSGPNRDASLLHPDFAPKYAAVQQGLQQWLDKNMPGYKASLDEGIRDSAYQQRLYAQGRTTPGKIVTYKNGTTNPSEHQSGKAADIAIRDPHGRYLNNPPDAIYQYYGHLARANNLDWGGDWTGFKDYGHVQLPKNANLNDPDTQAAIHGGKLYGAPPGAVENPDGTWTRKLPDGTLETTATVPRRGLLPDKNGSWSSATPDNSPSIATPHRNTPAGVPIPSEQQKAIEAVKRALGIQFGNAAVERATRSAGGSLGPSGSALQPQPAPTPSQQYDQQTKKAAAALRDQTQPDITHDWGQGLEPQGFHGFEGDPESNARNNQNVNDWLAGGGRIVVQDIMKILSHYNPGSGHNQVPDIKDNPLIGVVDSLAPLGNPQTWVEAPMHLSMQALGQLKAIGDVSGSTSLRDYLDNQVKPGTLGAIVRDPLVTLLKPGSTLQERGKAAADLAQTFLLVRHGLKAATEAFHGPKAAPFAPGAGVPAPVVPDVLEQAHESPSSRAPIDIGSPHLEDVNSADKSQNFFQVHPDSASLIRKLQVGILRPEDLTDTQLSDLARSVTARRNVPDDAVTAFTNQPHLDTVRSWDRLAKAVQDEQASREGANPQAIPRHIQDAMAALANHPANLPAEAAPIEPPSPEQIEAHRNTLLQVPSNDPRLSPSSPHYDILLDHAVQSAHADPEVFTQYERGKGQRLLHDAEVDRNPVFGDDPQEIEEHLGELASIVRDAPSSGGLIPVVRKITPRGREWVRARSSSSRPGKLGFPKASVPVVRLDGNPDFVNMVKQYVMDNTGGLDEHSYVTKEAYRNQKYQGNNSMHPLRLDEYINRETGGDGVENENGKGYHIPVAILKKLQNDLYQHWLDTQHLSRNEPPGESAIQAAKNHFGDMTNTENFYNPWHPSEYADSIHTLSEIESAKPTEPAVKLAAQELGVSPRELIETASQLKDEAPAAPIDSESGQGSGQAQTPESAPHGGVGDSGVPESQGATGDVYDPFAESESDGIEPVAGPASAEVNEPQTPAKDSLSRSVDERLNSGQEGRRVRPAWDQYGKQPIDEHESATEAPGYQKWQARIDELESAILHEGGDPGDAVIYDPRTGWTANDPSSQLARHLADAYEAREQSYLGSTTPSMRGMLDAAATAESYDPIIQRAAELLGISPDEVVQSAAEFHSRSLIDYARSIGLPNNVVRYLEASHDAAEHIALPIDHAFLDDLKASGLSSADMAVDLHEVLSGHDGGDIEEGPSASHEAPPRYVSMEAHRAARDQAHLENQRKLLGGGASVNGFLDPEFLKAAYAVGKYHMENGITAFADWLKAMRQHISDHAATDDDLRKVYDDLAPKAEGAPHEETQEGRNAQSVRDEQVRQGHQEGPGRQPNGYETGQDSNGQNEETGQKAQEVGTPGNLPDNSAAAANAHMAEAVKRMNGDLPEDSVPQKMQDWADAAKSKGYVDNAVDIARGVINSGEALDHEQNMGLAARSIDLETQYNDLTDKIAKAVESGEDPSELQAERFKVKNEHDQIARALKIGGTSSARAMVSRRAIVTNDMSVLGMTKAFEDATGKKLDPKTAAKFATLAKEHQKAVAGLEFWKQKALENAKKGPAPRRTASIEAIRSERQELLSQLNKLTGRAMVGIDPEVAKVVGKLVGNYIKEGGVHLADAIDNVRSQFPEFSARDIRDAFTGYGREVERKPIGPADAALRSAKRQGVLESQIEDLQDGKEIPKRGPRSEVPEQIQKLIDRKKYLERQRDIEIKRNTPKGMAERTSNYIRNNFLFNVPVFGKLISYDLMEQPMSVLRDVIAPAFNKLDVGHGQTLGDVDTTQSVRSAKATAKRVTALPEGFSEAWNVFWKGSDKYSDLLGESHPHGDGLGGLVGRMHGATKQIIGTQEFKSAFARGVEAATKKNLDITDPDVVGKIGTEAAIDAQNAKLLGHNTTADLMAEKLPRTDATDKIPVKQFVTRFFGLLAEGSAPFRRVPLNLLKQGVDYTGAGLARGEVLRRFAKNAPEKITPEMAKEIRGAYVRGGIGAAAAAIGWLQPDFMKASGYNGDDWKKKGRISVFGQDLPFVASHHPFFEAVQMWATARNAFDKAHGDLMKTAGDSLSASGSELGEQLPGYLTGKNVVDAIGGRKAAGPNKYSQAGVAAGRIVAPILIPGAIHSVAKALDSKTPGATLLTGEGARDVKVRSLGDVLKEQTPKLRNKLPTRTPVHK